MIFIMFQDIEAEDLVTYGIIPEFIGRMPLTVPLMSLGTLIVTSITCSINQSSSLKHVRGPTPRTKFSAKLSQ